MRKSTTSLFLSITALALALSASGCGEPYADKYPDLGGQSWSFQSRNYANLINNHRQAKSTPIPWAGWWWPYTSNGIANGTYGGGKSPAGKFDAARGRRGEAQPWEALHHGSKVPQVEPWWGHCNGWTAAAVLFPEPKKPIFSNGIEFSVADQKALLTEAAMEVNADFFGDRVERWNYAKNRVDDTVPNQFFLVLTNYMGRQKHPVLIDRFTTDQVWNQPVAGYRIDYPKPEDYLGPDPDAPDVHRIRMTATFWWASDNVTPGIETPPFEFEENIAFDQRTIKAELWLDGPVEFDANGKIVKSGNLIATRDPQNPDHVIGGEWMGSAHSNAWPDYMWVPYSVFERDTDMPEGDPYRNPFVDPAWVREYILTGRTDPSASPVPIDEAPRPEPSPTSNPSPNPSPTPSPIPSPIPSPGGGDGGGSPATPQ